MQEASGVLASILCYGLENYTIKLLPHLPGTNELNEVEYNYLISPCVPPFGTLPS